LLSEAVVKNETLRFAIAFLGGWLIPRVKKIVGDLKLVGWEEPKLIDKVMVFWFWQLR
jgi:hypothetical protein